MDPYSRPYVDRTHIIVLACFHSVMAVEPDVCWRKWLGDSKVIKSGAEIGGVQL